jgi:hypothetical protein
MGDQLYEIVEGEEVEGCCHICRKEKAICFVCDLCAQCAMKATVEDGHYCPACIGRVLEDAQDRQVYLEKERDRLREAMQGLIDDLPLLRNSRLDLENVIRRNRASYEFGVLSNIANIVGRIEGRLDSIAFFVKAREEVGE